MTTRHYHPAWKAYAHSLIREVPDIKASAVAHAIRDYILINGTAAHLRTYCKACASDARAYATATLAVAVATGAAKLCPRTCPEVCPYHEQVKLFPD